MDNGRRGFLRKLGIGAAAAAPMALAGAVGVDLATGKDKTAFRFQCFCGESVIAAVPEYNAEKAEKPVVDVECDSCHREYVLTWHGDHFSVR